MGDLGAADPAIGRLRGEFREIAASARELVAGLDPAALTWRAEPGRWSILECIDHLNVTGRPYVDVLTHAIQDARRAGLLARRPFKPSLKARLLIWLIGPPARLRFKSPAAFVPEPVEDPAAVVDEFLGLQERLAAFVDDAAGLDLRGIRLTSPVDERLELSLGEWFGFIAAHERRHLWQARRVSESPGFPA